MSIINKAKKIEKLANRTVLQELHDVKALNMLDGYMDAYLPWTGSALRPSAVSMLFNEMIIHQKLRVLEIGCGISTILLSRFLAERGGSIVSMENNEEWIGITSGNIKNGGEVSKIIHADICNHTINGKQYK